MTIRSYKYRIYPTSKQAEYLCQNFGSVRFIWNHLVENFNSFCEDGPNRPMNEKILKDNQEYAFLKKSISTALQQKRIDFEETKKQFFSKTRKSKIGRMKFKKRGVSTDSFRIPGQAFDGGKIKIDEAISSIRLPKMSTPIKMICHRKFSGDVRSVTVSRNKVNQYFVSVLVDEVIELKQNTGRSIGIDLGLTHLAILSNGMKIDNPRWFRENQSKLKKAQRHMSRKVKGSARYEKQRIKVARIHGDIVNQRKWTYHNLSIWLVNNYDTICMEDLNVKGMVKNRKLSKSISDASWSTLVSMIKYKSKWYGKTFHQIDRFFASSKTCSCCGAKVESLPLNVREWTCSNCGTVHDRDSNAATNILHEGLSDLYGLTKSEELSDYRRREELRPLVEMPKASSMKRLVGFINLDRTT